jgi:hypothetical protein
MKNITVKTYSELVDTIVYDGLLEHLKPCNTVNGYVMNVNSMPYANVKYAIRLMPKANNWTTIKMLFEICFDVADFWALDVKTYFAAKKYMMNEFARVVKTEGELLASQSTDEHLWQMAGADRLKQHSDTLPLIQLGKQFGQYPFDLGRKPYSEIFSLLVQTKTQNEVEREYQKLTMK